MLAPTGCGRAVSNFRYNRFAPASPILFALPGEATIAFTAEKRNRFLSEMRVLLNAVAAKMGGAANYIAAVARELAKMNGHEFIFLVPKKMVPRIEGLAPHIRVIGTDIAYKPFLRRFWFDQVKLRRILRHEQVDVLFATANFGTFFCPCRQILLVRNSLYFSRIYQSRMSHHRPWTMRTSDALRHWLVCRSMAAADLVMTPSRSMLEELRGCLSKRATVVNHYGVDQTRFARGHRSFVSAGQVVLLFTSLYSEHKNLGTLLRAVLEMERSGVKCKLVSTADPTWKLVHNSIRDTEIELAAELGRLKAVEFVGLLGPGDIDQLYKGADIFVYPSVVESFGHPLLEAMSAGLPIVAADVPINRELCGDAALYFQPFDHSDCARQISKVMQEGALRAAMVKKGAERVNYFQWSRHVQTLMQAFNCAATLSEGYREIDSLHPYQKRRS